MRKKRNEQPVEYKPPRPPTEEKNMNTQTRTLRPGEEVVFTMAFFRTQGKEGGLKGGYLGGKKTAERRTPEERSASAKKAVMARWATYRAQKESQ
jgi:hypothetical protein